MYGTYSPPGSSDEWYRRGFAKAKEVIGAYPLLNELTGGFSSIPGETEDETANFVLRNSFPYVTDEVFPEQIATLKTFEDALESIGVLKMGERKLRELKARINDDRYDVGLSVFTELTVAKRLMDIHGGSSIEVFPELTNGKFADILYHAGGEDVYIEVGNLSEGRSDEIIQRILNEGAKYAGERMRDDVYLRLEIDTAKLVFDGETIDESASVTKLKQEIDALAPEELREFRGRIDLAEMKVILNSADQFAKNPYLTGSVSAQFKAATSHALLDWVSKTHITEVTGDSMLKAVSTQGCRGLLVECHTINFYPSVSSTAVLTSFTNHLVRHIKEQVASDQIQPGARNLIVVQGYNWVAFDTHWDPNFKKICEKLKSMFQENTFRDLDGVLVFGRSIDDGVYAANPHSGHASPLDASLVARIGIKKICA